MNPAQYKLAMEQRAENREGQQPNPSQRGVDFCHVSSPAVDSATGWVELSGRSRAGQEHLECEGAFMGDGRRVKLPELEVGDDKDGSSSTPEPTSPLAPGPLSHRWTSGSVQLRGFDKQASFRDSVDTSTWDDGSDSQSDDGAAAECLEQGEINVDDWSRKPGDTSITYGVRLYMSNLDPDSSHGENCERLLRQILEQVALDELNVPTLKMRHHVKFEAFLRSVILSVPSRTWQQSVRGAFLLSSPTRDRDVNGKATRHVHQISRDELLFRMALFVGMLNAERKGTEEADLKLDSMRVEAVLRGYTANAAEILPLQRPARTLLPPFLYCMACELLGVRMLGPEVREVCRQIVSDYGSRAKLWMSPAQNADRFLRPLVAEFARWMRCNRDVLYQGSATEGLLRSIDDRLRTRLKTQVYRSPEHFLAVLGSLKEHLTDTPLPSYDPSGGEDDHPFDVSQTLKDVSRERFQVNREPITPDQCWTEIQALLSAAATNKGTLLENDQETKLENGHGTTLQNDQRRKHSRRNSGQKSEAGLPFKQDREGHEPRPTENIASTRTFDHTKDSSSIVLKPVEDAPGRPATYSCGDAAAGNSKLLLSSDRDRSSHERDESRTLERGASEMPKLGLDMYVDQCAWRVLHAASRTASSGDSFFVVQDLFGGDGVLVKTATLPTEPIKIRTKGMAVRVTTVDKYDIYHSSDVDTSNASPLPLMTVTSTLKEVIQFAPYKDANALSRRKSEVFAERPASDSPEEAANMQPEHALSGRFITISASLPAYRENHLEAAAGVLHAHVDSSPAMANCSQVKLEASTKGDAPLSPATPAKRMSVSNPLAAYVEHNSENSGSQLSVEGSSVAAAPRLRKSMSEPRWLCDDGSFVRRPSVFSSPPVDSLLPGLLPDV